jgi:transposase-like protein
MGKRKRYTNAEKVALARKASLPGCSIASVAHGEGLPQSTIQGFIKNIKKLEENSLMENNLKATHKNRTPTITKAVITSCSNYS